MSEAINQGHVTFEIDSLGIGTITFGHPLSNSLPGKILQKSLKIGKQTKNHALSEMLIPP
jgi:hypothetical protein